MTLQRSILRSTTMGSTLLVSGALCAAVCAAMTLQGCHSDHVQSVVHPAGPGAREIARLWWALFAVLGMVFLGTMILLLLAMRQSAWLKRDETAKHDAVSSDQPVGPPLGDTRFVVISGIVVPAGILIALLFVSLRPTIALRVPETDLTINITGHQWWWHIEYPELGIVTANEFYIPAGEPVLLRLHAADVIHSLWVPNLTGKMDLIPERINVTWLQADEPGRWRGQCAEYCGLQHALMAFWVVALPREEFDAWVEARQRPLPELTPQQARGREVFFTNPAGCHACHAIRDTPAAARLGPDLTHIASRLTLGAGTLPNDADFLARWIRNSHAFKPGNLMPATEINDIDLEALVEYLRALE